MARTSALRWSQRIWRIRSFVASILVRSASRGAHSSRRSRARGPNAGGHDGLGTEKPGSVVRRVTPLRTDAYDPLCLDYTSWWPGALGKPDFGPARSFLQK